MNRDYALVCVGEGWGKLINNLYDAKPKKVQVLDVKERFGGFRFYCSASVPEWYLDLTEYYEEKLLHICERCGAEGKQETINGWIKTLCEECLRTEE